MLNTILTIFAMYSITFAIKETSLLDKPRNFLARKSVFFYKLFSCSYCTGFHAGYIAYSIFNPINALNIRDMLLWSFSSAAISLIFEGIVNKLYKE